MSFFRRLKNAKVVVGATAANLSLPISALQPCHAHESARPRGFMPILSIQGVRRFSQITRPVVSSNPVLVVNFRDGDCSINKEKGQPVSQAIRPIYCDRPVSILVQTTSDAPGATLPASSYFPSKFSSLQRIIEKFSRSLKCWVGHTNFTATFTLWGQA